MKDLIFLVCVLVFCLKCDAGLWKTRMDFSLQVLINYSLSHYNLPYALMSLREQLNKSSKQKTVGNIGTDVHGCSVTELLAEVQAAQVICVDVIVSCWNA